jgi:2-keto-4-pentenoate hydratase/2-oxohepta-3-ene-1,7-dioic acid hydratase in catechol pathway
VNLLAPIPRPPKFICVGLNYRDHAIESKMEIPSVPTIFNKFATSVIGPGANIVLPRNSSKPDYEAELAFVIGKGGRHVRAENWQEHVFGYTIVNDVSARDFQMATSQWLMGKTFDTFAPMGPWIVPKEFYGDPMKRLRQTLSLGDQKMQEATAGDMIHSVYELIEYASSIITLFPGDVINNGTSGGTGAGVAYRGEQRFLKPGDRIVASIEGIGTLTHTAVAEPAPTPGTGSYLPPVSSYKK